MAEQRFRRRASLPAAAYDLAVRLGVDPREARDGVRLTQTGRMKRNLETSAWMAFTARQTFSSRTTAFDWLARFGPFGLVSARDALDRGVGRLDVMALGVFPLVRTPRTPALMRGELMRYLAELAWAPTAILLNESLRWRDVGPDTLAVSAGAGEIESEVFLSLDCYGRIADAFAPDRPRSATAPCLPTPWRGRFYDYRQHEGFWIPFVGEVAWEIDGKRDTYWEGRIKTWKTT